LLEIFSFEVSSPDPITALSLHIHGILLGYEGQLLTTLVHKIRISDIKGQEKRMTISRRFLRFRTFEDWCREHRLASAMAAVPIFVSSRLIDYGAPL
jgi:hypothetical protein